MKFKQFFVSLILLLILYAPEAIGQFEIPEFEKITIEQVNSFDQRFGDISWTGQGLNQTTEIDGLPTAEIRARLQARFGAPTLRIDDLVNKSGFRLGHAIQFEYRFIINDEIPLMILDVFGPFGRGLSYTGASRYIDLMPQIKRTLSRMLMEVDTPGNYSDYYYSTERGKWFEVSFENGNAVTKQIDPPEGMSIN